jgi:hypothetical protein
VKHWSRFLEQLLKYKHKDEHQQQWIEERPEKAQDRMLVADLQIANHQVIK